MVVIYVASDGSEFSSPEACEAYEKRLALTNSDIETDMKETREHWLSLGYHVHFQKIDS